MKIALIGYGKMGQMIDQLATARGHEIVTKISSRNSGDVSKLNAKNADVAIEFTSPQSAFDNVMHCLQQHLPVVSGSTGWNDQVKLAQDFCKKNRGSLLHASNFSVGVNIFFEINKLLARLMGRQPEYSVAMTEIHHSQKKDAPSGTAVTLAEQILNAHPGKSKWVNEKTDRPGEIGIVSERVDPAPGTHIVNYHSAIDEIEIRHTAHSRQGFAMGAILAAEYISDKVGIFSMKDVLGIPTLA